MSERNGRYSTAATGVTRAKVPQSANFTFNETVSDSVLHHRFAHPNPRKHCMSPTQYDLPGGGQMRKHRRRQEIWRTIYSLRAICGCSTCSNQQPAPPRTTKSFTNGTKDLPDAALALNTKLGLFLPTHKAATDNGYRVATTNTNTDVTKVYLIKY